MIHTKPKRELSDTELRVRSMTKATDPRRGKVKQVFSKHRKELNTIVTSFLQSIPKDGSVDAYTAQYQIHNNRWREHCRSMVSRYPWIEVNPDRFEQSVQLVQKKILRQKQPMRFLWMFYIRPLWWMPVLSAIIYLVYEYVFPLLTAWI